MPNPENYNPNSENVYEEVRILVKRVGKWCAR
jgi:phage host-nuclease inhibitor protein Gam